MTWGVCIKAKDMRMLFMINAEQFSKPKRDTKISAPATAANIDANISGIMLEFLSETMLFTINFINIFFV